MSTHNLCLEQKYEKYRSFLSENFQFLEMKFSMYLNRHVFIMFANRVDADKRAHNELSHQDLHFCHSITDF